jgi:protein MBA1
MTRFLLAPLTKKFNTRIAARGDLKMDWKLHKIHSKKVVSHRAQPLGEDQPDTAYRQIVVRIVSTQQLTLSGGNKNSTASDFTPSASQSPNPRSLRWTPDYPETQTQKQPRQKQNRDRRTVVDNGVQNRAERASFVDNGQQREVVEYMVLQKRVIRGVEEDWKIQGFAEPSTPEKIEEDDEYWRRSLAAQNPEAA